MTKRIRSVNKLHDRGPHWAYQLEFQDGTTIDPPGVIANHVCANASAGAPLPSGAVAFSVLRDTGNARKPHSNVLLAKPGHYAVAMKRTWNAVEKSNPRAWRLAYARTWGVQGTMTSNLHLLREAQMSDAHAVLVQPPQDAISNDILGQVDALRRHQKTNPPVNGNTVDILAHVPFGSKHDVTIAMDVAHETGVFFLDFHGLDKSTLGALNELRNQMMTKAEKPWVGATQVPQFTNGKNPVLAPPLLNATGIMGCVPWLGGTFPGKEEGVEVANKKTWPYPDSSRGVPRNALPLGTLSRAPQMNALVLTDDDAVAATPGMFDVHRNHVLVESYSEAMSYYGALARKRVAEDFFNARPELRALIASPK